MLTSLHPRAHITNCRPRRRWRDRAVLLCCAAVFFSSRAAQAAEFSCTGGNVQCLINAINTANVNGVANTIHLDASTYSLPAPGGFILTILPVISGNVTISGVGRTATAIEGPNIPPGGAVTSARIFQVGASGVLTLDHLTVRHGGFGGNLIMGGGILSNGLLRIFESAIVDNRGVWGAILVDSGTLSMSDTVVASNIGVLDVSAAIALGRPGRLSNSATAIIERTLVADNFNEIGFGIQIWDGASAIITDSAVVRNDSAGSFSGGIGIVGGGATLSNITVAGHDADLATGVLAQGASVSITHSTIVDNSTNVSNATGNMGIEGTILARSKFGNCASAFRSGGHNLLDDPQRCGDLTLDDRTVPLGGARLGSLIDTGITAFVPLLADSPAIDAGIVCPPTDQRGLHSPIDGNGDGIRACDIGAVEFYPTVNDLLRLDAVDGQYVPPSEDADPLTAGGEFRISPTFTNVDPRDICHVAFEVVTLSGTAPPVVLKQNGSPIGGPGAAVTAADAGAPRDLPTQAQRQYHFRIGVPQPEGIQFLVNVLGESTVGSCGP